MAIPHPHTPSPPSRASRDNTGQLPVDLLSATPVDASAAASAEETVAEGLADEVLNVPVCLAESRQVLEDHLQRLEEGGGQPDSVLCVWHGGRIAALQAHVCSQMHYGVLCSLCSPCVNQPPAMAFLLSFFLCVCVWSHRYCCKPFCRRGLYSGSASLPQDSGSLLVSFLRECTNPGTALSQPPPLPPSMGYGPAQELHDVPLTPPAAPAVDGKDALLCGFDHTLPFATFSESALHGFLVGSQRG